MAGRKIKLRLVTRQSARYPAGISLVELCFCVCATISSDPGPCWASRESSDDDLDAFKERGVRRCRWSRRIGDWFLIAANF
jgi:hypothetical protein